MFVAPRNSSSQPATRAAFDWPVIDEVLFTLMSPVREALNCGAISTNEAVSTFPNLHAISCSYRIFNSRASTTWDV